MMDVLALGRLNTGDGTVLECARIVHLHVYEEQYQTS